MKQTRQSQHPTSPQSQEKGQTNIYSGRPRVCLGMGENYLAIEGMELDLPATTMTQNHAATTLWEEYFEEDIAALTRNRLNYRSLGVN